MTKTGKQEGKIPFSFPVFLLFRSQVFVLFSVFLHLIIFLISIAVMKNK